MLKSKFFLVAIFWVTVVFFSGCATDVADTEGQNGETEINDSQAQIGESDDSELIPESEEAADVSEKEFTMEEITAFDGKEGRPAYIVIEGIVYDVTDVSQWGEGMHFGFEAATDVTDALDTRAPHGANLLDSAEIIGKIKQ